MMRYAAQCPSQSATTAAQSCQTAVSPARQSTFVRLMRSKPGDRAWSQCAPLATQGQ